MAYEMQLLPPTVICSRPMRHSCAAACCAAAAGVVAGAVAVTGWSPACSIASVVGVSARRSISAVSAVLAMASPCELSKAVAMLRISLRWHSTRSQDLCLAGGRAELDADCSPNRRGSSWGGESRLVSPGSGSLISWGGGVWRGGGLVEVWTRLVLSSPSARGVGLGRGGVDGSGVGQGAGGFPPSGSRDACDLCCVRH